jgi:2,3-diketo-5-methylthio-1-phosphopentane phosphatase
MTPLAADERMSGERPPALFLDFDNTITRGDVLDRVLERYSASEAWRRWEAEWQSGRMSTRECLERQTGDLRVTSEELIRFTDVIDIDAAFGPLVSWTADHGIEVSIVSDNFQVLIDAMLRRRGLPLVPIYANGLAFTGNRPRASFPFLDPACKRCAHCKGQHLRRVSDRPRIFAGDGLSDICPALSADVVFAKDSLAAHLQASGRPYRRFGSLDDVLDYLSETAHV